MLDMDRHWVRLASKSIHSILRMSPNNLRSADYHQICPERVPRTPAHRLLHHRRRREEPAKARRTAAAVSVGSGDEEFEQVGAGSVKKCGAVEGVQGVSDNYRIRLRGRDWG